MILKKIPATFIDKGVPAYNDHCLFTDTLNGPYHCTDHFTALGIITMFKGSGRFKINNQPVKLDEHGFLIVNKGSRLSFQITEKSSTPLLLYFNTTLSEIITNSAIFSKNSQLENINQDDFHDFSLVEHIHYKNASLKDYMALLLDLGSSCASFHSLKADMLIRKILDDLITENHSAMQASSRLSVVKKSTRIALYQRLSMARAWINQNFKNQINTHQMADIAMLNSEHFLRLYKQAFNITPHQYVMKLRIQYAKILLTETREPIAAICQQIGLDSLSSFSVLFKERVGVSPSEFRKQYLHSQKN